MREAAATSLTSLDSHRGNCCSKSRLFWQGGDIHCQPLPLRLGPDFKAAFPPYSPLQKNTACCPLLLGQEGMNGALLLFAILALMGSDRAKVVRLIWQLQRSLCSLFSAVQLLFYGLFLSSPKALGLIQAAARVFILFALFFL